jgi:acetoin utilization protein AcuB
MSYLDQIISPSVPILTPSDSGARAMDLMEESNYSQLPLVSNEKYESLIQENDLFDWASPQALLSTAEFQHFKPAILASSHPYEALRLFHQMELSILPVIDAEQKYLGCITKDTLLNYIAENSGVSNPGGIIVLEIAPRNYTLYEIARICENEDVIILNTQVHTNVSGKLEVTLKLNRSALESVVSSFERYNYHVKEVYGESSIQDDIEGNYNLLMNYINM